jgi:uncharacterized protein YneF (UPF0154 family)
LHALFLGFLPMVVVVIVVLVLLLLLVVVGGVFSPRRDG